MVKQRDHQRRSWCDAWPSLLILHGLCRVHKKVKGDLTALMQARVVVAWRDLACVIMQSLSAGRSIVGKLS